MVAPADCRWLARAPLAAWLLLLLTVPTARIEGADTAEFFRGLNLNGPPTTIDGHRWEGRDSSTVECKDKAFENQNVPLRPSTDPERAQMIRSSRWGGNRVVLREIPPGAYSVFLYVWEDNSPEAFSIAVNGKVVEPRFQSGPAGAWAKLGPWSTEAQDGAIVISSRGGAANFSGVELWRGPHEGSEAPLGEEELAFFEKRIRPLLVKHCYECHSADAKSLEGDLLVDSRPMLQRRGANGAAVVPGDAEASLLIKAVRYVDENLQMPPDGKLADAEIADLEQWVRMGAPDPRTTATKFAGKKVDVAAAREFWSLRPLLRPQVPEVNGSDWPANDVDRFVLAKLQSQGLAPADAADKRALLRRVTYDLTGLPPTPEELQDFLADESPEAFLRVVDRLLDSPRYGERWGRHWLDVVRYADTAGDNSDYPIPQNHRYRDWVIDAFNSDLPYDEFVRDQLAGDLRGGATEKERQERIVATGYIANSRRFGSRVDDYPQHLTIEDTLDNLGRSFLGLTVSCARCHDHKFDPITTRDYYGLYGIFQSTRYPWPGIELDKEQRDLVPLVPVDQLAEAVELLRTRKGEQTRLNQEVKRLKNALKTAEGEDKARLVKESEAATAVAEQHRGQPLPFEMVYAVADAESPAEAAVQVKGDPAQPGDVVERRFLTVLGESKLSADCRGSGRAELAEWILADENPLAARVMANRIWQHHFGRGIVPTPNDFGKQGKPATHPELLDYLASVFRDGGWSVKAMHRLILSSKTYQQSAMRSDEAVARDPSNDWLSGFPRRRLDAESIRDAMLALGGNLDLSRPGAHPFPPAHTWGFTQHKPFKAVYESRHRSVYLMTQRIQRHPYLAIFDGADPSTSTAARMSSTTPLQALFLLNDAFVHEQSRLIAERIVAEGGSTDERIQRAFTLLFSRPAVEGDVEAARDFLEKAKSLAAAEAGAPADKAAPAEWQAFVRALLRLNEFVYLD
ncbi:DUF1553 domain-containing protein [Caulifigura coniformis]|nr:PSD1 and planctomycete cytochrome C domain-containing protein [Caulifigura coniformis]